ncbi:nuclear transport factor 2 family protein [Kitasatospora fiedleri]|uniref:nuclear transport factor 2 family protein n=1 Tax=Kitasatospora fiedleri TaxID=2991545 RepID=UPI00249AEBE2|nr:nuclear transport factor 2 family protein [Kitasatospora fiedleri]
MDEKLDGTLVARMREYLAAGAATDLEALEALYDEEFENLRIDEAGQVARLTKAHFMARFRALAARGEAVGGSTEDVRFLATTRHGDQGTVVVHRCEDGVPARYTFVWRWADGRWATLLREFTFERDVTPLLRMMAAAAGDAG